jgi:hypothetical protein
MKIFNNNNKEKLYNKKKVVFPKAGGFIMEFLKHGNIIHQESIFEKPEKENIEIVCKQHNMLY